MKEIIVEAPAKINLSLAITGVREDGYHLLETVMQSVSLSDTVAITASAGKGSILITANCTDVPLDSRNTCYKAARAWLKAAELTADIKIIIDKNIPSEAGLGGGSADAAAVLFGLNTLHNDLLDQSELAEIALTIGADVPFCLYGGTAFCEGIGEKITHLPDMPEKPLLIVKPDFGLSTPAVFSRIDELSLITTDKDMDHQQILAAVSKGDWHALARFSFNQMETAACLMKPEISDLLGLLRETDPIMTQMSGSGTSLFAVYDSPEQLKAATGKMKTKISVSARLFEAQIHHHGPRRID